jgi:DNA-binding transcriptional MerR regulator
MAHEIAKLMLEHAGTFLERTQAIQVAMSLGMPLSDIERYLDWLDSTRGPLPSSPEEEERTGETSAGK